MKLCQKALVSSCKTASPALCRAVLCWDEQDPASFMALDALEEPTCEEKLLSPAVLGLARGPCALPWRLPTADGQRRL